MLFVFQWTGSGLNSIELGMVWVSGIFQTLIDIDTVRVLWRIRVFSKNGSVRCSSLFNSRILHFKWKKKRNWFEGNFFLEAFWIILPFNFLETSHIKYPMCSSCNFARVSWPGSKIYVLQVFFLQGICNFFVGGEKKVGINLCFFSLLKNLFLLRKRGYLEENLLEKCRNAEKVLVLMKRKEGFGWDRKPRLDLRLVSWFFCQHSSDPAKYFFLRVEVWLWNDSEAVDF